MTTQAHAHSFAEWRDAARGLLRQRIAPYDVQWQAQGANDDLFGNTVDPSGLSAIPSSAGCGSGPDSSPLQVTRDILAMFETASCYRADDRWAFLYRILWRWSAGEHAVLSPADEDGARLHAMIKAVNLEAHKMNALMRFRERPAEQGAPRFIAWFEPAHDVLPRAAAHFVRRMAQSSWLIATPQGSAMWDGKSLHFGPPAVSGPADLDECGEALWLAYYRSIFNPAGTNAGAMELPLPVRHWSSQSNSRPVPGLAAEAGAHASTDAGPKPRAQAAKIGILPGAAIRIAAIRPQPPREQRDQALPLEQCRRCELWRHATQAVAGLGPQDARVMLVGDQPSDVEDIAGKPFVGPAGKLLNSALQQAGMERGKVYLTNAVKHFKWEPRGRRRLPKAPLQREAEACGAWLEHELELISPKVVVALGPAALKSILKTDKAHLGELLNQPIAADGRWIVATYHPSHVLSLFSQQDKDAAMAAMVAGLRLAQQLAQKDVPAAAQPRQEERRLFA